MTSMLNQPQRPQSHVNEQKSEKAFRALFGDDNWVIRGVSPDYGRDLEVELFENGQATGVLFGVQLKSIDKVPLKGRISKSGIEASSLRYWRKLDYPFMVALYSVPADQFFARWAHSYDWHHKHRQAACTAACVPGPKTVTFNYSPVDRLTRKVVEGLPGQLKFFRSARHGDLRRTPMPIRVEAEPIDGHSSERILDELRGLVNGFSRIRFAEPGELATQLTFKKTMIRAVLPGDMRSHTSHIPRGHFSDPDGPTALAADGLVALSWLFFMLQGDTPAADLLKYIAPYSRSLFDADFDELFLSELIEADRTDVIEVLKAEERRRWRMRGR